MLCVLGCGIRNSFSYKARVLKYIAQNIARSHNKLCWEQAIVIESRVIRVPGQRIADLTRCRFISTLININITLCSKIICYKSKLEPWLPKFFQEVYRFSCTLTKDSYQKLEYDRKTKPNTRLT